MNFTNFARTVATLAAGAALFATLSAGAEATPGGTFNVTTTIGTACTVTDDGPADLAPTYDQPSNSGTGAETVLNTFCNGTDPTVTFTDALGAGTQFYMVNGSGGNLLYQLSNTPTCSGIAGDGPINEGAAVNLTPGPSGFDICAAVTVTNNVNTGAPAGTYTDTVTYTIAP